MKGHALIYLNRNKSIGYNITEQNYFTNLSIGVLLEALNFGKGITKRKAMEQSNGPYS